MEEGKDRQSRRIVVASRNCGKLFQSSTFCPNTDKNSPVTECLALDRKRCGATPSRIGSDPQSERAASLRIEVPIRVVGDRDVKCDVLVKFSTACQFSLTGTRNNRTSCSRNRYCGRHSFLSRHMRQPIRTFKHISSLVAMWRKPCRQISARSRNRQPFPASNPLQDWAFGS